VLLVIILGWGRTRRRGTKSPWLGILPPWWRARRSARRTCLRRRTTRKSHKLSHGLDLLFETSLSFSWRHVSITCKHNEKSGLLVCNVNR
jgi:hypothetical protein